MNYTFVKTEENQFNGKSCFPEPLEPNIVYYCPDWQIASLLCPCGCKEQIMLNMVSVHPYWKVDAVSQSLIPSVNKLFGCKSHFTITNGIVKFH